MIGFTELFESYASYMNEISGGNEMMAGLLSASILATLIVSLRGVPSNILNIIKRNTITTFSILNAGDVTDYYNNKVNTFLAKLMTSNSSRSLSFNPKGWRVRDYDEEHSYCSIGYGWHYFFWNGRLFWLRKDKLESSGAHIQKEEITISTFGRSHKPFHKLAIEMAQDYDDENIEVYVYKNGSWERLDANASPRSLESIILDTDIKKEIISNIDNFHSNEDFFKSAGLPWKLTYVLHGEPGTGKTSLIKALASHYNKKLHVLNITQLNDKEFEDSIRSVEPGSILAIEDFDSAGGTHKREGDNTPQRLSLTAILNTLDGLVQLNDVIIFLTTNHLEMIDEALYRKGRVDFILEIGTVKHPEILEYSKYIFKDYDFNGIFFKEMLGCNISAALLASHGSAKKYIEYLEKNDLIDIKKEIKNE